MSLPGVEQARVEGSFRDPSGYVFSREGRIFRALDEACFQTLNPLLTGEAWSQMAQHGWFVPTQIVNDPIVDTLKKEHPGYNHFLEHDRLPFITYPYEWTFSMLADAALLTLDIQRQLLESGLSLKDGTAYNVQFPAGKPVFIDISSIEKPARMDLWFALGQYQRMFLYPLLLHRYRGWDFRSCFLAHLDGCTLQQVGRNFGWSRWRPKLILDVGLPLFLEGRASVNAAKKKANFQKTSVDSTAQKFILKLERKKIVKLAAGYQSQSHWSRYTATCTYDDAAESAKKQIIKEWLGETQPASVLDIGCNTGDYSYLAADSGARVIAADADHDSVDLLYRRLKTQPANITPLVIDLGNPSPAIGFMNRERPGFLERLDVDCVFALALLHHLLVSANFTLEAARDLFHSMTNKYLVLEYVPTDDPMFERLMQFRVNLFGDLTLAQCQRVFGSQFDLVAQRTVQGTKRTLLLFKKNK